jgi:hypothetical protein
MLYLAAFSLILVSFGHSYLGEKRLLRPLFESGGMAVFKRRQSFAKNVLRAGWHILTLTWIGLAILLIAMQSGGIKAEIALLWTFIITFTLFGIGALIFSRGRHLSWIFFFITAGACAVHLMSL